MLAPLLRRYDDALAAQERLDRRAERSVQAAAWRRDIDERLTAERAQLRSVDDHIRRMQEEADGLFVEMEELQALDREEVTAKIKLPLLEAALRRVKDEITETDTRATAMLESIESATAANPDGDAPVIDAGEPLRGGDWVVIAGAEKSLSNQRVELTKLQSAGYGAVILQSGEWFQPVVPFASKVDAQANLAAITSVVGELLDSVTDAQPIWSKVRDEMADAAAQFPVGAAEPELEESNMKAYTLITSLTWNLPNEPNYAVLRRYAEELAVIMRGIDGTEEVEFFGSPDEEILVEIDASELVGVGLSPQQLANQVSLSDAKVSAGQLRSADQNVAMEVESELETLEQIRQIPVQTGDGQFTRLSDIASVSRGVRYPLIEQAIISGKPAIVLGTMMKSGLRVDQWAAAAKAELAAFSDRMPQGVSLDTIFDQSAYVADRINTLILNLIISAALVVVVTLVAMGWRSAIVVGTALPMTIFAVFGWFTVFNVPIHQMSVTGLIIALGLLIDNAIVVVDEIQVEMQHGDAPLKAVTKTVKYLQVPLMASTLTTVLTFLPIYLLPGAPGEFVGAIALSVILSLVSSLAISLTVIAALAGRMLGDSGRQYEQAKQKSQRGFRDKLILVMMKPGVWWNDGLTLPALARPYRWSIGRAAARPLFAVALTMTIPLIGFIAASTLENQFFPLLDRDQFHIEIEFSAQTAIARTEEQVLQAREVILQHENVEDVHWFVGESVAKFYYNLTGQRENQSYYAQAMVQLKSEEGVDALVRELQTELSEMMPAARVLVRKFQQGPPFDAPVEMRIYGPNIDELRRLGMEVRALATTIRVNAQPLDPTGWMATCQQVGLAVKQHHTGPMALLNPQRIAQEEGLGTLLKLGWNLLIHPEMRQRILDMRRVFTTYRHDLGYIIFRAQKSV